MMESLRLAKVFTGLAFTCLACICLACFLPVTPACGAEPMRNEQRKEAAAQRAESKPYTEEFTGVVVDMDRNEEILPPDTPDATPRQRQTLKILFWALLGVFVLIMAVAGVKIHKNKTPAAHAPLAEDREWMLQNSPRGQKPAQNKPVEYKDDVVQKP